MLPKCRSFFPATGGGILPLALAGTALLTPVTDAGPAEFEGISYQTHQIDPARETLRLFWRDEAGNPYRTFRALDAALRQRGERLRFAMNAGIYEPGWIPSGLHVEDGRGLVPLNRTRPAPPPPGQFTPNFYLLPNGVFFITADGRAGILETDAYAAAGLKPRLAVQSGPLLLDKGVIHPVFRPESTSRLLRNGVGVDRCGLIHLVATERSDAGRINLHTFARLFHSLGCDQALYLDGDISEFYLRSGGKELQATTAFAAILALTEPLPAP